MKKTLCIIVLTTAAAATLIGCAAARQATQKVMATHRDTIYMSNLHYDSIYVSEDKYVDRSRDTVYVSDRSVEYRYRLLRDTLRIHHTDTIPCISEVEVVKTVSSTPLYMQLLASIGLVATAVMAMKAYRNDDN